MAQSDLSAHQFPRRTFLVVIGVVSTGLILSAFHTYFTLQNLREEYLEGRARDISASLQAQIRGPGRRSNPTAWEEAFQSLIETSDGQILYLSLVDSNGRIIAEAAASNEASQQLRTASPGFQGEAFVAIQRFSMGRGPRWERDETSPGLQLKIATPVEGASFLVRQGYLHLLIACLAVGLLIVLSFYLLRTIDRYLAVKVTEESEKHLKTLGKMSATLAHEIRNPLGAMKGLTQVAQEELPHDHATQTMLKTVVQEAERLERLVSDLLTFARPKDLRLEKVDLNQLISAVVEMLRPEARAKGIGIDFRNHETVLNIETDESALRQILYNLLLNGIQASREGGEVEVHLDSERSEMLRIEICDRGPGLGESDPEEFFQPFRTTKTAGSGLGLPISRQLCQKLGGKIDLRNREGGGTCSTVEIPVR